MLLLTKPARFRHVFIWRVNSLLQKLQHRPYHFICWLTLALALLLLLCPPMYRRVHSAQLLRARMYGQSDLASIGQHLLSAHFDTRATLGGRKFVRLIAVLDTNAYNEDFICQFMHESGNLSFSAIARKSNIGFGMPHGDHNYNEFLLSCKVENDLQSATSLYIRTADGRQRSQVMRVEHNPLSLGHSPTYQQLVINCVPVTFGRPSEHRLIEWLEAQRLLGMDKVQLHFHHMLNREFWTIAQAYRAEGLLNVRQIGCPFCEAGYEERLGLLLMAPAINQCFYENLGGYRFTAVYDLDEIIVPQQHPDYPSLLTALESGISSTSSFAFRNWYHFSELGEDASVPRQMYMLRHPFRTKEASPKGYSIKSIHRSDCVVALHNHISWEEVPEPNTQRKSHHVPLNLGALEHYKQCHFEQETCNEMIRENSDRQYWSRLNGLMGDKLTAAFQQKANQLIGRKLI